MSQTPWGQVPEPVQDNQWVEAQEPSDTLWSTIAEPAQDSGFKAIFGFGHGGFGHCCFGHSQPNDGAF